MTPIPFKKQTLSNNCVSACIAMLVREHVDVITACFHDSYQKHEISVHEFLEDWEVVCKPHLSIQGNIVPGKLYLVTVPSLNVSGMLHQVIVDWRDTDVLYKVIDPCMGKEGKLFYTGALPQTENGRQMNSWIVDYEILEAPELDYKVTE